MRVRYGDLSCYGSDLSRTSDLNLMATTGMRYRLLCYVTCLSSIKSSLETGCYPRRVGLDSGDDFVVLLPSSSAGLSSRETTIASMLKSIGYGTKMISKWYLGRPARLFSIRYGFDSYFGLPYSNDMAPNLFLDLSTGRRNFPPLSLIDDLDDAEPPTG